MLELILQLFGGRGSGSGNKGGHVGGVSASDMTGTGKNGGLTVSDLVSSQRTFSVEDVALYDKSGPTTQAILDRVLSSVKGDVEPTTITFTGIDKTTGTVSYRVGWSDGTTSDHTYHKSRKK